jgi:hypothetical protein
MVHNKTMNSVNIKNNQNNSIEKTKTLKICINFYHSQIKTFRKC